jgi:hypothetical protein
LNGILVAIIYLKGERLYHIEKKVWNKMRKIRILEKIVKVDRKKNQTIRKRLKNLWIKTMILFVKERIIKKNLGYEIEKLRTHKHQLSTSN